MKHNFLFYAAFLFSVFLVTSCGPAAHVHKDAKTDFSHYKTYMWIEKDQKRKKEHNSTNDLMEQKMRAAIDEELQKTSGWKKVTRKADVLLTYDVLVQKTLQQRSDPVYANPYFQTYYSPFRHRYLNVYYPSQYIGYNNYTVPVKEGTITISMIDARKRKTVWQGWTTDEVNSSNLTNKEIESSVKAILRKFDPAKN